MMTAHTESSFLQHNDPGVYALKLAAQMLLYNFLFHGQLVLLTGNLQWNVSEPTAKEGQNYNNLQLSQYTPCSTGQWY